MQVYPLKSRCSIKRTSKSLDNIFSNNCTTLNILYFLSLVSSFKSPQKPMLNILNLASTEFKSGDYSHYLSLDLSTLKSEPLLLTKNSYSNA